MDYTINGAEFNQDRTCFSCAMSNGIRVYNVDPLTEKCRLEFDAVGSVSKVGRKRFFVCTCADCNQIHGIIVDNTWSSQRTTDLL